MGKYVFTVNHYPVSWKAHGGYGKRSFNPRSVERLCYQKEFRKQGVPVKLLKEALKISLVYQFEVPKSYSKTLKATLDGVYHLKRPDLDNLNKFVIDALKGVVIDDDCYVCHLEAQKKFGPSSHTIIQIETDFC